nr:MAG TPA: hypothetical protein [Caudoviricetes sp.]
MFCFLTWFNYILTRLICQALFLTQLKKSLIFFPLML